MFYRKNLPVWERIIRSTVGIAILGYGIFTLPASPLSYLIIASGFTAIATGFIGFCPMCAMVGRKPVSEK